MEKIYRCGWCGQPINKEGDPLPLEQIKEMDVDWDKAEQECGNCCRDEHERGRMVQVTSEMALDVGEPEMEGSWINWW